MTIVDAIKQYGTSVHGTIRCNHCDRVVPVAPGRFNVSVPHVRSVPMTDNGGFNMRGIVPCKGNDKRAWRDAFEHLSKRIALQHEALANDAYWEGL